MCSRKIIKTDVKAFTYLLILTSRINLQKSNHNILNEIWLILSSISLSAAISGTICEHR